MKNVTHLITTLDRGGAENQLLILVRQQIAMGKKIEVVPLKGQANLIEDFMHYGANVNLDLLNKSFIKQLFIVKKLLSRPKNIYHAHLPQAELLLAFSGAKQYFVSRHFGGRFYPRVFGFLSTFLSNLATKNAYKVIAISEFVKNYLVNSGEVKDHRKIKVIHYGFDKEHFVKMKSNTTKEDINSEFRIGTLARLSVEKDLKTLILGFHKYIQNESIKATLEIYGEGNDRSELQNLINELKLESRIFLKGKTSNAADAINSLDLFVLTSKFEGFGMVLLEAMSLNKIILCSDIPTTQEVLGHNGAGLYFKVGDPSELALKISIAKEINPKKIKKAQEDRLARFNVSLMESKIDHLYSELN